MATQGSSAAESAEHLLVITRTLDAPRDIVWKAFTESERLAQWWGPKGSAIRVKHLDFRPGGQFHYVLTFPDGNAMWGKFTYGEILKPELIVFASAFSDEEGNTVRAPFSATWPLEILNRLTLVEQNGQTTLTLQGGPYKATEEEIATFAGMRDSMNQGFAGTLDQLADYLATL